MTTEMTAETRKLTPAQRRTLRAAGVDPAKVRLQVHPDAARGAERKAVTAALKRKRKEAKALSERKAEIVREFLRSNPAAAEVVAALADAREHVKVLESRAFYHAVEIVRDGGWCTHVLARGDSFADAAGKLTSAATLEDADR